jgi:steroid delta-isomerase-like uncharacterized protein
VYNFGDVDAFDELMAPGYVRHFSRSAQYTLDNDLLTLKSTVAACRRAFPDMTNQVDGVIGDDNEFTIRWSGKGTHRAPFLGVPATGRPVAVAGVTVCKFKGDLVEEEWVAWDVRDLLESLGITALRMPGEIPEHEDLPDSVVRSVHRKFVTGVTVVSAIDGAGVPRGLAVNAFMSVSLAPPLILVCVAQKSHSHDVLVCADAFAVNILAADQFQLARRFSSRVLDKFEGVPWQPGILKTPLVDGCCAHLEARVIQCVQASTHSIFVGHVMSAATSERLPLVYMDGKMFAPDALRPAEHELVLDRRGS